MSHDRIHDYPQLARRVVELADMVEGDRDDLLDAEARGDQGRADLIMYSIENRKAQIRAIREEVTVTPMPPSGRR